MYLDETPPGARVRVVEVTGAAAFRRRLLELGFVPGTEVLRVGLRVGDPQRFRVRDAVVALRRADARHIQVELT